MRLPYDWVKLFWSDPVVVPRWGDGGGHRPLQIVARLPNAASPRIVARPIKFSRTLTLLTHCGQLLLTEISKFDSTRCHILSIKRTEFDFRWGYAPDTAWRAYSAPTDPLAVFMGPTSKVKRGRERGERKGAKGRGHPHIFRPGTAPAQLKP